MTKGVVAPRAHLRELAQYQAGRTPAQVAAESGQAAIKLASNETPFPPPPAVMDAVVRAAAEANRYPDITSTAVVDALAHRHGIDADTITVDTGSVALIHHLVDAIAGPGDEVVFAWPSFNAYVRAVATAGAVAVRVPLRDERHDAEAMAEAVTARTKIVLVCNPNNPTSTALGAGELVPLLERVDSSVLVVLDEAYREFVTDRDVPDGLSLLERYPNLAVLRTFSKAYGLAGLRLGFCVTGPSLTQTLRLLVYPFAVSSVAQAAAVACLEPEVERALRDNVAVIVGERLRVQDALRRQGFPVPESQANFVWVPVADAAGSARALEDHGVIVRPMGSGLRITIGTAEENDALLAALAALGNDAAGGSRSAQGVVR